MNGITRGNVIRTCELNSIPCVQKNFSLFDVYGANEAFVTGTFGGITPVTKIDGKIIGDGTRTLTKKLDDLYEVLIREEIAKKG
jgi:branched-chain amino acid aminotransferase